MNLKIVVLFLFLSNAECCRDENNNLVDWFIIYKLPKLHHTNPLVKNGQAYIFTTSNFGSQNYTWKLSERSINAPDSIPGLTLAEFYKNQTLVHLFYNDEAPPDNTSETLGHTKGVVVGGPQKGFWMIHSVPLYPNLDKYGYPKTGESYGQSFLCLSLDIANLNLVGQQLLYNEPNLYAMKLDEKLRSALPNIEKVVAKKFVKTAPHFNLVKLSTLGGKKFYSFAKNRHFGKDLYSDWVAPAIKQNLMVESWLRGRGTLNSDCTKQFSVKNVKDLKIVEAKVDFKSEDDHSKWAVTDNGKKPWFCIGDINRQEHQKMRGGGTVCTNAYPQVWANYHNAIKIIEPCVKK